MSTTAHAKSMMMLRSTRGRAIVVGRASLWTKQDAVNDLAMQSALLPVKSHNALAATPVETAPIASQLKIAATDCQKTL